MVKGGDFTVLVQSSRLQYSKYEESRCMVKTVVRALQKCFPEQLWRILYFPSCNTSDSKLIIIRNCSALRN